MYYIHDPPFLLHAIVETALTHLRRRIRSGRNGNRKQMQIDESFRVKLETRINPPSTPRSETTLELRQMGISRKSLQKHFFKKIVVSNSVIEELKECKAKNNSGYGKKVIRNLGFGNFTKKYRLNSYVKYYLGIRPTKSQSKTLRVQKRKRQPILKAELAKHVTY